MAASPENQEKEEVKTATENQHDNEELAREIPTVTPDDDNLEPVPDADQEDK